MNAAHNVRPVRLWYQSYVDEALARPYLACLREHLDSVKDSDTTITVHEMTPPDSFAHPLVEFRCAQMAVKNAIRAEREGYDAVLIGHMQDSGLWEARAAVGIPVLGLGEVSMLHACTLGTRSGIVTINPQFIPGIQQQIQKYGLEKRIPVVRAIDHQPGDFMRAFESVDAQRSVVDQFCLQARGILEQGVEVLIPGGGIPMLLLSAAKVTEVGGAPILNGLPLLIKTAEMQVFMRRRFGLETSRLGDFKLPPLDIVQQFMDS